MGEGLLISPPGYSRIMQELKGIYETCREHLTCANDAGAAGGQGVIETMRATMARYGNMVRRGDRIHDAVGQVHDGGGPVGPFGTAVRS